MRIRAAALAVIIVAFQVVGSGRRPVAAATPGSAGVTVTDGAHDPAISPDGSRIAVGILGKIFVLPASGGEATELTTGVSWDSHPAWSPDGRVLAYAHQLPGGTDLVLYNFAAGTFSSIYHTNSAIGQVTFAPSGSEVFFLLDRNQYDSHLWRVSIGGGKASEVTFTENWHEWSFALSPDGKEALVDSGRYGGSNLYLVSLDSLTTRRITKTTNQQGQVNWTHDGKRWIYIDRDNGIDTVVGQTAGGGAISRVFSSPYDQKEIALSPDDSWAVMCAGRHLYHLDLASGQTTPIPFTARISAKERAKADLLITNATLFDGAGHDAVPNMTVEIRDGKIQAVRTGNQGAGSPTDGVPVINARGRFLMPGLMDNHYHYWSPFDGAELISRGITTIRDPGAEVSSSVNFKEAIHLGLIPGPDIYTCGPLIDGLGGYHPKVDVELNGPEAAAALVRALKAQGVDSLKVYFLLNPEVLRAVIKEAHAQGLPVTGHIGVRTGWREALEAGIDGLNHIRVWKDFLPLEKQPQGDNESLDGSVHLIPRMQADWSDIDTDGTGVASLIELMKSKNVGFDPTLSIQRPSPEMRKQLGMDQYAGFLEAYQKMGRFVSKAENAGVMLLAGTDDGSLFDELESYAAAGVPNKAILMAATANGAKWLGKNGEFGALKPGMRANLILVDGNPLADIKDTRKIQYVIKDGLIVWEARAREEVAQ
ncbi:MAG TPA: amidohydrolase family protein [Blastocatellia bacterium]|nr:amidohydrolase family protein [Blastocatellia bacterium]